MSEVSEFAKEILYGRTLQQKLIAPASVFSDFNPGSPIEVPRFPGRPPTLGMERESVAPRKDFPKAHELHSDTRRGEVLHFFANHELLAMEIMALVLLRFPEAPPAFRRGIVKTIQEEQSHLSLYIERMQELGVQFGTLSVNDYFWNCMKDMRSPLDFVTQMSLSFEQANLDFSLQYRDAVAQAGDLKTAEILDRVYREEIGHVKHGLIWFNRWRQEASGQERGKENFEENEWQAYLRLLPSPMTPRRAKGADFSADARRQAGFSEIYIQELEICSGSKGRPPVLWSYNPLCDAEIVRGRPGLSPSRNVERLNQDLEHLPLFLAGGTDCVLLSKRPPLVWIKSIQDLGFSCPEFIERTHAAPSKSLTPKALTPRHDKWAGFEPWGWSPASFEAFKPLRSQLVKAAGARGLWHQALLETPDYAATGLGALFSKSWSVNFLQQWIETEAAAGSLQPDFALSTVGTVVCTFEEALHEANLRLLEGPVLMKAPWGTSGTQNKKVMSRVELEESSQNAPLRGWIEAILKTQKALVIEPFLDKVCDLSVQMEISDDGVKLLQVRRFLTGTRLQYQGTLLNQRLVGMPPEVQKFFSSVQAPWQKFLKDLGERLRTENYRGPAGVDALIFKSSGLGEFSYGLKPLVELNPRWTMGRVALALEEHVAPGTPAAWLFQNLKDVQAQGFPTFAEYALQMSAEFPLQTLSVAGGLRIAEGVLWTNPPDEAREIITALCVGSAAHRFLSLRQN
ncbi:MAG: DUF455 family protein [Methylotenera sp.]|nr:DUF455 family protein [Oligoflexia bacterium]